MLLLFTDRVSQQQDEPETKIPGSMPAIDKGFVIMGVQKEVGGDERSEAGEKDKFPWQIGRTAKKNRGEGRKIRPGAGRAG